MRQRLHAVLQQWVLPLGLLLFLTGFFVAYYDDFFRHAAYFALLLPSLLCLFSGRDGRQAFATPMGWLLLAFFAYLNASPLWNPAPTENDPYLKYTAYILLFFHGIAVLVRTQPQQVWLAFRLAAVLAAVSACYAFWHGRELLGTGTRFHAAAIAHPLLSGNVYGLFLAVWLAEQLQRDHWPRWLAALCALPVLVLVLLTQARSPLLGILAAGLALLLLLDARHRRGIIVAGVLAAVLLVLFGQPLLRRGLSQRPEIWAEVWGQALAHPWFGHGLGSEPVFARHWSTLFDAHNVPLAVFFYGGLAGLLLWLGVLAAAVRAVWQQRGHVLGLLGMALLAYGLVTTAFEAGYFINRPKENWFYLWLPLALAFGLARAARTEVRQ